MDPTEPDRLFVSTSNLNSEAIVNFVKALCAVAQSELASPRSPRVYSTAKIVEVAHHNMGRIRLVWTRIWAVLGEYFAWVGCHPRVNVALYAVDALRQLRCGCGVGEGSGRGAAAQVGCREGVWTGVVALRLLRWGAAGVRGWVRASFVLSAPLPSISVSLSLVAHINPPPPACVPAPSWYCMHGITCTTHVTPHAPPLTQTRSMKFLERDELGNFSFQNDFLRPFVAVMRQADLVETREMVVRCMAQMVQARVGNIKSGWKPMFMVFTAAARDRQQQIVRMGFDTIERVVREHFDHITGERGVGGGWCIRVRGW